MAVHVGIVRPPYDRLILDGSKTVECRLTTGPRPPFGVIVPGERVYLKRSGGAFFAVAVADRVWMTDGLTPGRVEKLRRRLNDRIHGEAAYWRSRRDARYGTLIWLREVRPTSQRPRYRPQNMRAWYTLDDAADPLAVLDEKRGGIADGAGGERGVFEVVLTRGALDQRSVRITRWMDRFPPDAMGGRTRREAGEPVALHLKGGPEVLTDIVGSQKIFRWRGWGPWFKRVGLKPGDGLRFTPVGGGDGEGCARNYLVEPVRRAGER